MPEALPTKLTRTDCVRDNVRIICRNSSSLGCSINYCKRGFWVLYEVEDHKFIGRSIGRVTCEGRVYVELVQASLSFSSAYIRWVNPEDVREVRPSVPRTVFKFFSQTEGWQPGPVFQALEYGVSDLHDQIDAWALETS